MAETIPRRTRKLGYDPGAVPGESYDLGPIPVQGPDGPPIYVPVQPEDQHHKMLRRLRWAALALILLGSSGYWFYKTNVDPIRAQEAFDSGAKALQAGRYQQAILSFDHAVALAPDYVEAYQLRGRANMALSKPLQAGPDFSKVIALRPQDAEGYIERGNSHLALNELQDALTDAGRAIQLNPKLAASYSLRGAVLRELDRFQDAVTDLTQAVQLSPDMDNYYQLGAAYQEIGDHKRAIEEFNEVISFDPLSSQPYYARAKSYRAIGDQEAADRDHRLGRVLDGHQDLF